MINLGEEELICDLAEVYSIYDYKAYSPKLISTLAVGLGVNTRIRMKQMNAPVELNTLLLAVLCDNFSNYIWAMGGRKGKAPGVFVQKLYGEENAEKSKYKGFSDENALRKYLYNKGE